MATDIYVRVIPGGLMALNQAEASKLEDLVGKQVRAVISQPRNLAFHKKYFALLKVCHDMANTDFDLEQFRLYCQVGAAWCMWIDGKDGQLIAVPKSISFGSMDQLEFERLYNGVLNFACEQWALDDEQINAIVAFM